MLDPELSSPDFEGVPDILAGTIDGGVDRSAGSLDAALSGVARTGAFPGAMGEMLTGTAAAEFADEIESVAAAALVRFAGTCSLVPFDRGFALVEVESAV